MFKMLDKFTCDKSYLPFKVNEEVGNCVRNHGAQAVLSQLVESINSILSHIQPSTTGNVNFNRKN